MLQIADFMYVQKFYQRGRCKGQYVQLLKQRRLACICEGQFEHKENYPTNTVWPVCTEYVQTMISQIMKPVARPSLSMSEL